jgi:hypothetical protein
VKDKVEKNLHIVFAESLGQCFGSFSVDPIPYEIECGECLKGKSENVKEKEKEKKCGYPAFSKSISQCFGSFIADIITFEIECG